MDPALISAYDALFREATEAHGEPAVSRLRAVWSHIKSGDDPSSLGAVLGQRPRTSHVPGLSAKPWWTDSDEVAHAVATLERSWMRIRDELRAARRSFTDYVNHGAMTVKSDTGDWTHLMLRGGHASLSRARELCPETTALIEACPRVGGMAMFSTIGPGARIMAHCGPTNARLTAHLGLEVPRGCALKVGGEEREWAEGKCIVFDDSFEHEAWNPAATPRTVLLVDLWHPELSNLEIELFKKTQAIVREHEAARALRRS